jgi:flavodoxin
MKKLFMMLMAGLFITACTSKPQAQASEELAKKALVLYFSVTNTTKQVAEYIQQKTSADIEAIQLKEPYSTVYDEIIKRSGEERAGNVLPELLPLKANLADYDVIFLGYPLWFGTYAQPVKTLLANVDFKGKKVVPFCTSGSSGIKQSLGDLQKAIPGAQIPASVGVRSSLMDKMPAAVDRVLIDLGLMEGKNEVLADYSAQQAPSAEETAIFDAAISTYPMMNGTKAVSVGSRKTSKGTDYKFVGEANGAKMDVYITKENGDVAPYFTAVDR